MLDIRPITRDEVAAFRAAINRGFGSDLDARQIGPESDAAWLTIFPLDTLVAAFDRGAMVATFGSFDLELAVPGGVVPMAGTTVVTVHPTHRRRGVLTRMMALHLDQARHRGQPLAGLWASEETIYGRFGYGQATPSLELTVPPGLQVPPGPDDLDVRFVETDEARSLLPPLYDQVRRSVPGHLTRTTAWWDERHLNDYEWHRDGSSALRIVVVERGGVPVGYVLFRQQFKWEHGPQGEVEIEELVALDDDGRRGLWQFVTHVDLYPKVSWWNCPLDEPLLEEIDRARSVQARLRDTLWLRLLDVPAALEARRYEYDGTLVLAVTDDAGHAGGTWRLEVTDGEASCRPATGTADIETGAAALGALYLGGRSAVTLARSRRLAGAPAAVARLDRLFRTVRAPHCSEQF